MNYSLSKALGRILSARKIRCALAESCTGGSLSAAVTRVAGSSQWFDRGFVTYSNQAKIQMLGVPEDVIASKGAVSEETARAMAHGAIARSEAQVSVAITGVAGPGGGTPEKPVGTVWIAWAGDLRPTLSQCFHFEGDREAIRQQTVEAALSGLINRCETSLQVRHPGSARYFFALWPDEQTARALYEQAQTMRALSGSVLTRLENLHMTLVYLGKVHPDFIKEAMKMAEQMRHQTFSMTLARLCHWPHHQTCWMGLEPQPEALHQFVASLKHALITIGLKPESQSFIPHVTIGKASLKAVDDQALDAPVHWQVRSFCLVQSSGADGSSAYEIIGRWPFV